MSLKDAIEAQKRLAVQRDDVKSGLEKGKKEIKALRDAASALMAYLALFRDPLHTTEQALSDTWNADPEKVEHALGCFLRFTREHHHNALAHFQAAMEAFLKTGALDGVEEAEPHRVPEGGSLWSPSLASLATAAEGSLSMDWLTCCP